MKMARVFLLALLLGWGRLEPPQNAQDLHLALGYLVIAIIILSRSGVDLRGIVATSAVITAVIGFSLQDTLRNIMGGRGLPMERTTRGGDWGPIYELEGGGKASRLGPTSG